ncbi:uncharacterized protein [Dendrobates tinctorius]|uniref:uncharacterized protein isoform X2 n=1 Tax=Dendrobates tinctorius TaxID=92724 RepID=UPI003CCA050C
MPHQHRSSVIDSEFQPRSNGQDISGPDRASSREQDIAGVPPSQGDTRLATDSGLQSLPSQRRTNGPTVSSLPLGHSGQSLMPLIRASVTPATWQVYGGHKPTVWVLGHSFIYWAGKRAEIRPGGKNFKLPRIQVNWRGIRGLLWDQIFPELVKISKMAKRPLILVLHAGGNDLCKTTGVELFTTMKTDIKRAVCLIPDMVVVWSDITSRTVWHGAKDLKAVDKSRRRINVKMATFVKENYGIAVHHHNLEEDISLYLRPDGVHLTDIGLDMLLTNLQDGVEQALMMSCGGRSPV